MTQPIRNWDISKLGPETASGHHERTSSGFYNKYLRGNIVLDVGYSGGRVDAVPVLPHAIGIDLGFPGYDGVHLPYPEEHADCIFSSHCLEHMPDPLPVIRDWWRALKIGGFMIIIVPHMWLYEKRDTLPSLFNGDHKRFYTPQILLSEVETALRPNSYRVRSLRDVDQSFDYAIPPERHSAGRYEIELVLEKILQPEWSKSFIGIDQSRIPMIDPIATLTKMLKESETDRAALRADLCALFAHPIFRGLAKLSNQLNELHRKTKF